jgi:salicylate biosynthesis isochorismate synthase
MSLLQRGLGQFAELCQDGAAAAAGRGRPVLVSLTFEVPGASVAERVRHLHRSGGRTFVWASSWSGQRRLAVGSALDVTGEGVRRFEQVSATWKEHREGALVGGTGCQPSLVGGFSFLPRPGNRPGTFPDALMWLPAAQLTECTDSTPALTLNAWVGPGSDCVAAMRHAEQAADSIMIGSVVRPSARPVATSLREKPSALEWKLLVQDVLDAIAAGTFDKLVLARQLLATFDGPFAVTPVLASMMGEHAVGAVFGVQMDDHWFVGRTPECLLHLDGEHAESHGLAGSVLRDCDPIRDAQLAHRLQADPKLVNEHAIVADFVERTLQEFFRDVRTTIDKPVLKLADIQHRQTTISASDPTRRPDLLCLAGMLHPTPAVGGFPRTPVLQWLERHEPFDRGWYAAPIGWAGVDGGGEFAVAIRSAMIIGETATLYAGCGIVEGSDPDEEYVESCVKMQTMRKALGIRHDILVDP